MVILYLVWLIFFAYPFMAIWWMLRLIWWIITLPIRLWVPGPGKQS